MPELIELEARIAALEMVVTTHILQSGLSDATFDPKAFASARRDAWAGVSGAMCQACDSDAEEHRFTRAYAAALERLGDLLVMLADPIQEAIDEVGAGGRTAQPG
jgi:glycine/D-amino acid oxidase-like deaminating enzyme